MAGSKGLGIVALLIGITALGLGGYTLINTMGISSQISPEEFSVHLINPDEDEVVNGKLSIQAIIIGSDSYSVSILRNGTSIGTILPLVWNTTTSSDGWWNISIIVQDSYSTKVASDEVMIFVFNNKPAVRVFRYSDYTVGSGTWITVNFDTVDFDDGGNFNLITDRFTCPYAGYYLISGRVLFENLDANTNFYVTIFRDITIWEAGTASHTSHVDYISSGVVDILYLDVEDTVELKLLHFTTGGATVYGSSWGAYTYFTVMFIDDLDLI